MRVKIQEKAFSECTEYIEKWERKENAMEREEYEPIQDLRTENNAASVESICIDGENHVMTRQTYPRTLINNCITEMNAMAALPHTITIEHEMKALDSIEKIE